MFFCLFLVCFYTFRMCLCVRARVAVCNCVCCFHDVLCFQCVRCAPFVNLRNLPTDGGTRNFHLGRGRLKSTRPEV